MKQLYRFLILVTIFIFSSQRFYAQLVSGNSFMQGTYVEVGVTPCGSYGTSPAPPSGYHPRSPGGGLGFVADFGRDGWSVGSPTYCGDYFLPGSPVEGWGVEVAGTSYINSDVCGINNIPGSILSYTSSGGTITTVWQGTVSSGTGAGLQITQTTTLKLPDLYFITSVRLCNTTGSAMSNVYYGRNVDPDNDVMLSGGSYTTRNVIEAQPRPDSCASLVTSTGINFGCFLALGAMQQNARVSVGGFSTVAPISGIYRGYSGGTGRDTTLGHASTSDEAISIGFYWPTIAAGGCVEANFVYLLNRSDLADALTGLGSPSVEADGGDISATLRDTACGKRLVMLTVNSDSSYDWSWSPSSVLDRTTGDTVYVNSDTTVTITLTGTSSQCSNVLKRITIVRDTSLNFVVGARDTTVCSGLPVMLDPLVNVGSLPTTYTWTPSISLSSTSIRNPISTSTYTTTYYLDVNNTLCDIKDTVTVYRLSSGTFTQTFCPGSSVRVGSHVYNTSGVYSDTFNGGIPGCDSIMVTTILPTDTLISIADTSICVGQSVVLTTLSSGAGASYLWTPSTGLSSTTVASPTASPTASTTYIVQSTLGGCNFYDTVNVNVIGVAPTVNITYTPNPYCKDDTLLLNAYVPDYTAGGSRTYSYTGAMETFTVPTGVTLLTIDASGAKGGDGATGVGGLGGRVQTNLTVTPGQVLNIFVGGAGGTRSNVPGYNGGGYSPGSPYPSNIGGGGGATDIRTGGTALTDRIVVAAGGGGGGYNGCTENGGAGGGTTGIAGGIGCGSSAAGGGTPSAGGVGGTYGGWTAGSAGTLGVGGAGGSGTGGAGGGGGYYGGGGGAWQGGGGGSSYSTGSGTIHTSGYRAGNGELTITWPTVSSLSPYTYTWTPSTGLFPRTDTATTYYIVTGPATYYVEVNNSGCIGRDTINIKAPLDVHVGPDTTVCAGSPVQLNAVIDYDTTGPVGPDSLIALYTGAMQSFTVPSGVTSLAVEAYGAQGANNGGSTGGLGGLVQGTLAVTPGQILYLYVGGQTTGYNGGGAPGAGGSYPGVYGGGGTDIRIGGTALTDRVLAAAGGGGAGNSGCCWSAYPGGDGGGATGAGGAGCCGSPMAGGATTSAGGGAGYDCGGCGYGGTAGSLGQGGTGSLACSSYGTGSGGGGGYYGGGGGATCGSGGSGGGGSSFLGSLSGASTTGGVRTGNGMIIIRWTGSASSALTYTWTPTTGLSSTTVLNPVATTRTSTDYIITVTAGGCTESDTARISVIPIDSIYQTRTICFGGSVRVGASTYTATGTYRDTLRNSIGCDSLIVTNLIVIRPGSYTQSFCPGSGIVVGSNVYNISGVYRDTFNGGIPGCDSIVVTTILPEDTLRSINDTSICTGMSMRLSTTSTRAGSTYSWTPTTGLSSSSILSPTATPTVTTTYVIQSTLAGCNSYDTVTITVGGTAPVVRTTISPDPYCKGDTLLLNAYVADYLPGSGDTFSYTGSMQSFTVPASITTVTIEAFGAQGISAESGYVGGLGARMRGDFTVTPGDQLIVLTGSQGTIIGGSGGGGGGSFVVKVDPSSSDIITSGPYAGLRVTPLVIAGGGGGTRASVSANGNPGVTTNTATSGSGSGTTGGGSISGSAPGTGGIVSSSSWGSGGGGFRGNGSSDGSWGTGGISFLNGGSGGINRCGSGGPCGGFGSAGSGGGCDGGGGGGGYTGGDGGRVAGGGGSYNSGTSQSNSSGVRAGNGIVYITWSAPVISASTIYTWTPTTGLFPRTDTATTNVIVSSAATYIVSVNKDGCIGYDTVKIKAPLDVHVSPDTTVCAGSPVQLNAVIDYDTTGPVGPDSLIAMYTGAMQSFTVPSGVTSLAIEAYGAQGANNGGSTGGLGGLVQGTLAVTPGQILYLYVGGQTTGYNGGGSPGAGGSYPGVYGGGGTDIRIGGTALTDRVLVAAGGGGAGNSGCCWSAYPGGDGGGATGAGGAGCCGSPMAGGATTSAGGGAGYDCGGCGYGGTAGTLGQGGTGSLACSSYGTGSGGGGGYYGGGGGATCGSGGSGGGGSSFLGSLSGASTTGGVRTGNGMIIIRWTGSASSALTYTWTPTTGLSSTTVLNPVATTRTSTDYIITVTAGGCTESDTARISVIPIDSIYQTRTICFGGSVRVGGSTYTATGTYRDTFINSIGCDSLIVTNLIVIRPGTYTQSFCPGSGVVVGSNVYNISGVYRDTFNGGIPGCDSIVVTTILPEDTLRSINDTSICTGMSMRLSTTSTRAGSTYSWTPTTGLSSSSILSPTATPTVTTTYVIQSTLAGCNSYDTVTITVGGTAPVVRTTISPDPYCKGDTLLLNAYVADYLPGSGDTFSYTGALETFTVPAGVTSITIDARGAQGGTSSGYTGGLGARMQGTFAVTPGQVLNVVVGGAGITSYNSGSGGGGSGVLDASSPWIIAGGGGGACSANSENGQPGLSGTSGGNSSGPGGSGGSGGQKGFVSGDCGWAGGGGGFSGDGYGGNSSWDGGSLPGSLGTYGGARSWLNGGAGGVNGGCPFSYSNYGAFGCGGGGCGSYGGGGGGGYSGGGGGQYVAGSGSRGGGGGGSYNTGTSQTNTDGYQTGDGAVYITWSAPAVSASTIYTWTPTTGLFPRTDTATTNVLVGSAATYVVSVNKDGCIGYDTVKIKAPLDVYVSPDTSVCAGSPVQLNAVITYDTISGSVSPDSIIYSYTGSMQSFTVPAGVTTVNIEAFGAQGFSATGGAYVGGLGARMRGDFTVTPGSQILVLVGGQGASPSGTSGGGGGGSFVVKVDPSSSDLISSGAYAGTFVTPLVIAGGGGGTRTGAASNGNPGVTTINATLGSGSSPSGGGSISGTTPGNGGSAPSVSWGSAGGGYRTNGANDASYGTGGISFLAGAAGGIGACSSGSGIYGGYGSGGSGGGCYGGGGGGGYTGGDGGWIAGGGGSYNSGASQSNTSGVQSGNGKVIIRWAGSASSPLTYTWTPTTGLSSTTVLNPIATTSISQDYIITVTAGGCTVSDTASIIIAPKDSIYQALTICAGQTVRVGVRTYSLSGTYRDTLRNRGGCDSLVVTNLIVNPVATVNQIVSLCSGRSYSINGNTYSLGGLYRDTLSRLGSCDSIVNTTIIILPASTATINGSICTGQSYLFNGVNRTVAGIYLDTFISAAGCDSILTLNLRVFAPTSGAIITSICAGQSYLFNGIGRTTAGIYLDTLLNSNGCDSVVTLTLSVRSTSTGALTGNICSNQVYAFNGVNLNTSGTYLDTFTNVVGCDSIVTLTLTVRATTTGVLNRTICAGSSYLWNWVFLTASGSYIDTFRNVARCDSVVTLNLTVVPPSTGTINTSICAGQSYLFNGISRTIAGAYLDTFRSYLSCDSVVTLNLTVLPTSSGIINASICAGRSYLFNGLNRTIAGAYLDTLTNSVGCDSFVTLNLLVNPRGTGIINQTICTGNSYLFNGINRTVSGAYLDTLLTINGCDSVVTLNLTVSPSLSGTINTFICSGSSYLFNGVNLSVTGSYLDTISTSTGCDSVVTLNLFVRSLTRDTLNVSICSGTSYFFNGANLSIAGVYNDTLTNAFDCDSFIVLNLVVRPTSTGLLNVSICADQNYLFNGVSLTVAGTYLDTFLNAAGCDSILTLNLTVLSLSSGTLNITICAGQRYLFNGVNLAISGTYLDTLLNSVGCDSTVTLNLTVRPFSTGNIITSICWDQSYLFNGINRTISGTYLDTFINIVGCDSVVTLNLTVNPMITDTQDIYLCKGQTFFAGGAFQSTSGTYRDTIRRLSPLCDSFVITNIHLPASSLLASNDTTVCYGSRAQLNATGAISYTWRPSSGLSDTSRANPIATPLTTTSYVVEGVVENDNLIYNGDFSLGNVGFSTSYTYAPVHSGTYGIYSVGTSPSAWLSIFRPCGDHTTGTGPYLFADGSTVPGTSVFCQTVPVTPFTDYSYSAWLVNIFRVNPADIQFNINGSAVGAVLTADSLPCVWRQVAGIWNSGLATTATVCIIDLDTSGSGNDFGIDDISLKKVCHEFDTVTVFVTPIVRDTIYPTTCSNIPYRLPDGSRVSVSGLYTDTLASHTGCDSILYTQLTVIPTTRGSFSQSICPGSSYLFNGLNRTAAGSYLDTLINSGGCDSVVTLNLSILSTSAGVVNASICAGQNYLFNGINRTIAGAYLDTLVNAVGCDSVLTLNLSVLALSYDTITASICAGTTYLFNGVNLSAAGTYRDTMTNRAGCDSMITLNLSVRATSAGAFSRSICAGQSYLFNGINRTSTGAYLDTMVNSVGCDSVVTLNLTVNPTSTGTINATICNGGTYLFNGVNRSATGAYLDTFVNYVGCDSIVTLNLLVNPTSAFVQNIALCDPATITIGGRTYSTSGTYIDTLTNRFGCDSVLTTNLTMHPIVFTTLNPVICEGNGVRVGVNLYSFSGTYQDTLRSMYGCDSIITTNLTVIPTVFSAQNFDLCLGESITVGTHTYSTDGIFSDTLGSITGCDSVVISSVTVHRPVTLIIDTSICKGNTYGGVPYTGDADMYDTIPSSIGCDSVHREVHIRVLQDPALQVSRDIAICEGASAQLLASGGNGNYSWSPPIDLSCLDCADPIATPLNTTIYTVSSNNCNGNLIVANVQVSIQPSPIIDVLNQDTCVYMGQKIRLYAAVDTSVYASVSWSMGGQLLCTNCLTHIAQPLVNGFYYGVVTDSVGCTSMDSFEVCVKTDCPDSTIEVPNFMSANNDGFNDVFSVKNPENLDLVILRIFDRWGELLYETTNSQPQWDGTFKGTPCTPGVYVYYLEGHCPMRSNFIKTGNVTILK